MIRDDQLYLKWLVPCTHAINYTHVTMHAINQHVKVNKLNNFPAVAELSQYNTNCIHRNHLIINDFSIT